MKKPIIIISTLIILIVSCNQNPKAEEEIFPEITSEQNEELPNKEVKNRKKEPKKCICPSPFETTETQVKIDYLNGKYITFCSWDYSKRDSLTSEFRFYNQLDSIILEGDIPSQFKIVSLDKPIIIRQSTVLDNGNKSNWEMTPIFDYKIELINNRFKLIKDFIYQPPIIEQKKIDSILKRFHTQPKHLDKYDKFNPPFASEEQIMDLFICAVNKNKECLQAYDSLRTRFVTDGAIGELYYELKGILKEYKVKNDSTNVNIMYGQ